MGAKLNYSKNIFGEGGANIPEHKIIQPTIEKDKTDEALAFLETLDAKVDAILAFDTKLDAILAFNAKLDAIIALVTPEEPEEPGEPENE